MKNVSEMTNVIAAYPCLGKTTLCQLNKNSVFDREFNESRSIIGMSEEQIKAFFRICADMIFLQIQTNTYEILFITEDERLISELYFRGLKPVLVFPNAFDSSYMKEYKDKVIGRSGIDWWNRVLACEIPMLTERIKKYEQLGYDVRLTDSQRPYIEDVIELPNHIVTPTIQ